MGHKIMIQLETTHQEFRKQMAAAETCMRCKGSRNIGTNTAVMKLSKFDGPRSGQYFTTNLNLWCLHPVACTRSRWRGGGSIYTTLFPLTLTSPLVEGHGRIQRLGSPWDGNVFIQPCIGTSDPAISGMLKLSYGNNWLLDAQRSQLWGKSL
jgi:hypothetical protein